MLMTPLSSPPHRANAQRMENRPSLSVLVVLPRLFFRNSVPAACWPFRRSGPGHRLAFESALQDSWRSRSAGFRLASTCIRARQSPRGGARLGDDAALFVFGRNGIEGEQLGSFNKLICIAPPKWLASFDTSCSDHNPKLQLSTFLPWPPPTKRNLIKYDA